MRVLQLGVISAAISLAVGVSVSAANAQALLEVQGTLSPGDAVFEDGSFYDQYSFSGDSGQQITISLVSQDFDSYLILLDPEGRRISENDDISRSNRNSQLVIVLPSTGTYTVVANSYEAGKNGEYEIKIDSGNGAALTPQAMAAAAVPDGSPPCNAALISAIGDIETDRGVSTVASAVRLGSRYRQLPTGRANGVKLLLEGPAALSVLRSPQLLNALADELIRNCTDVGAVIFGSAETGFEKTFGFLPEGSQANQSANAVSEFACAPAPTNQQSGRSAMRSLEWGYQICE